MRNIGPLAAAAITLTLAVLLPIAATKAWRIHGPAGATPESIYGKN